MVGLEVLLLGEVILSRLIARQVAFAIAFEFSAFARSGGPQDRTVEEVKADDRRILREIKQKILLPELVDASVLEFIEFERGAVGKVFFGKGGPFETTPEFLSNLGKLPKQISGAIVSQAMEAAKIPPRARDRTVALFMEVFPGLDLRETALGGVLRALTGR